MVDAGNRLKADQISQLPKPGFFADSIGPRIVFDLSCQFRLEYTEIWFEVAPLLEGPSIYRLPHLLGTRRTNGAIGLVKVET